MDDHRGLMLQRSNSVAILGLHSPKT